MFVVFNNSTAIAAFETQAEAVEYWRINGGTIILYPEMSKEDLCLV